MPDILNLEPFSPISHLWLIQNAGPFLLSWQLCFGVLLAFSGTGPWSGDQPGSQRGVGLSVQSSQKGFWVLFANWFSCFPKFCYSGHCLALPHQIKVLLHLFSRAGLTVCITERGRWGDPCPQPDWVVAGSFSKKTNQNETTNHNILVRHPAGPLIT